MRSLLVLTVIVLGGCNLYFSGDDQQCGYGAVDIAPSFELRDPQTGTCQPFGGGGGGCPCGQLCDDAVPPIAQPDWGMCFSQCDALDESTCIGTTGCRAAYTEGASRGVPTFRGCWSVAPSGPIHGACENLDAYGCSQHDDCSAYYREAIDDANTVAFSRCAAETNKGCFSDQECGTGAHCSTSDGDCQSPPGCENGMPCPDVCYGQCVMDNDSCTNVSCGAGSHCEEQCHPGDPGTTCQPVCVPDQACDAVTCPAGSECVEKCDGVDPNQGCGTCTIECVPVGTCEGLATEATCAARADCTRVYAGTDCTCYPNGQCQCAVLTYERCETL